MKTLPYLAFGLLLLVFSCTDRPVRRTVLRSFYYWNANFHWRGYEEDVCRRLSVDQLYVRFFEVRPGRAGSPALEAVADLQPGALPQTVRLVPAVFMLQQVFASLPDTACLALAWQTAGKI